MEACPLSTIVYRISVLLGVLLAEVPVGTHLGLFWLLWALMSGRFLLSRGAVFPALADGGLPAEAVRRSSGALAYGRWAIQTRMDQRGHDVPVTTQTRLNFDVILPLWGRRGPR